MVDKCPSAKIVETGNFTAHHKECSRTTEPTFGRYNMTYGLLQVVLQLMRITNIVRHEPSMLNLF